jgi:uncharacterized membrane protein
MPQQIVHPEDVDHPPPPLKDQVAAWLAERCATVEFGLANVLFVLAWGLLGVESFPYPGLTLALSIEAILLTVFVLVEQRLQNETQRRESDADLKNDAIAADASRRAEQILKRIDRKVNDLKRGAP